MALTQITLVGTYQANGEPCQGFVTARASADINDTSAGITQVAELLQCPLDENGAISIPVWATDDPTTEPVGVTYLITETINGDEREPYSIAVPRSSPNGTINLPSVNPALPGPTGFSYAPASLIGAPNGLATLDGTGNVPADQLGNVPDGGGAVDTITAGAGIAVNAADPASPVVSNTGVLTIAAGNNVSVDEANPSSPTVSVVGVLTTVQAGAGVTVDNTEAYAPVVAVQTGLFDTAGTASGLFDQAVALTGSQTIAGVKTFTGEVIVPTAVNSGDAVPFSQVQAIAAGLTPKVACQCATTTTLPSYTYNNGTAGAGATLTGAANGVLTVDTHAVALGDYVLVKNETGSNAAYNGIYQCTQAGSASAPYVLTRATDNATSGLFVGASTFVSGGSTGGNQSTSWVCINTTAPTVGTTAITWTQNNAGQTYSAGSGLTLTGNQFSVTAGTFDASGAAASALATAEALIAALAAETVTTAGNQTIAGAKTFTTEVVVPSPANPGDAVNLSYASSTFIPQTAQSGIIATAVATAEAASFPALFANPGDLAVGTGTGTGAVLPIGTPGEVLTATSSPPYVGWAPATGGGGSSAPNVVTLTANATTLAPECAASGQIVNQDNFSTNQPSGTLTVQIPSGAAVDGQRLLLRIESTNVQNFSWASGYGGSTYGALPVATSGGGMTDYFSFIYRSSAGKWDYVAGLQGFV